MSQNTGKIESEPRKPNHALRLHHVGEALVAAMLQRIDAAGKLSRLACAGRKRTVEEDLSTHGILRPLRFHAESASLALKQGTNLYVCDGAQKVDVLCASDVRKAMAFELKLGSERLQASEFKKRFQIPCEAFNEDKRLKGSMISVLDRNVNLSSELEATLSASTPSGSWEVVRPWWLVVRRKVWSHWKRFGIPPLEYARFLLFEDIVEVLGGRIAFNETVRSLIAEDFYQLWELGPDGS